MCVSLSVKEQTWKMQWHAPLVAPQPHPGKLFIHVMQQQCSLYLCLFEWEDCCRASGIRWTAVFFPLLSLNCSKSNHILFLYRFVYTLLLRDPDIHEWALCCQLLANY